MSSIPNSAIPHAKASEGEKQNESQKMSQSAARKTKSPS